MTTATTTPTWITRRYPNAHYTQPTTLPAGVDGEFHDCPDLGEPTENTTAVIYQRHGWTHTEPGCELCLPGTLAQLHHGNPQPLFVRIQVLDDTATEHTAPATGLEVAA